MGGSLGYPIVEKFKLERHQSQKMGVGGFEDTFSFSPLEPPDKRVKEVDEAIRFLKNNPLFYPIKSLDDLKEEAFIAEAGSHFLLPVDGRWERGLYPSVMAYELKRLSGEGIKPLP